MNNSYIEVKHFIHFFLIPQINRGLHFLITQGPLLTYASLHKWIQYTNKFDHWKKSTYR